MWIATAPAQSNVAYKKNQEASQPPQEIREVPAIRSANSPDRNKSCEDGGTDACAVREPTNPDLNCAPHHTMLASHPMRARRTSTSGQNPGPLAEALSPMASLNPFGLMPKTVNVDGSRTRKLALTTPMGGSTLDLGRTAVAVGHKILLAIYAVTLEEKVA